MLIHKTIAGRVFTKQGVKRKAKEAIKNEEINDEMRLASAMACRGAPSCLDSEKQTYAGSSEGFTKTDTVDETHLYGFFQTLPSMKTEHNKDVPV